MLPPNNMVEIERKFLVQDVKASIAQATASFNIFQGYLSNDPERTVRLRLSNNKAFLTIKGASSEDGTTRVEWEQEIPLGEAKTLMPLCLPGGIKKTRYWVPAGKHNFEVDVFEASLTGLVLAEIELESSDEKVELPNWIGEEVTGDKRYYNSYLSVHGIPS